MTWQTIEASTPGWLHPGEGSTLAEWAAKSTGPLVEIGSFAGKSTLWIASTAPHPVISIDHHRGNPEIQQGRECFIPEAWDEQAGCIDSAPLLRRTIRDAGFDHKVTIIAAPSSQVGAWWTTPIGFLFIDGDHGPGVLEDIETWVPHLTDDGILALHDTAIPAVKAACDTLRRRGWHERAEVADCLRVFSR